MRRAASLASFVKFDITAPSYSRAKGYDGNWSESKHLPQKKRYHYACSIEPARARKKGLPIACVISGLETSPCYRLTQASRFRCRLNRPPGRAPNHSKARQYSALGKAKQKPKLPSGNTHDAAVPPPKPCALPFGAGACLRRMLRLGRCTQTRSDSGLVRTGHRTIQRGGFDLPN